MKRKRRRHDYGECHVCGGRLKGARVKQEFWIKGKLIVIEGVPAGVCPRCGERVVRAEVGRAIGAIIEDTKRLRRARTMRVPVIKYDRKVA